MRILGIDHGNKRIGLAVSDALGMAAHGLPTLRHTSDQNTLAEIQQLVEEREIAEIVVGLPLNMDGSEGEQTEKVRAFAALLQQIGKPIHFLDERLTSERAHRTMSEAGLKRRKHKQHVDRMAAQFILQTYLDMNRPAL